MATSNKLKVEIWSDVVCPFCYMGKRHFEAALSKFGNPNDLEIEFKSFQLDPNYVQDDHAQGRHAEHLAEKYGKSLAEAQMMLDSVTQRAKEAGLDYHFEKSVSFNTFDAHRVAQKAKEKGLGLEMEEALFKGYFTDGKDLGDREVLKAEALKVGLSEEDFDVALTDDKYAFEVKSDIQEAANLGITGVPFFVFNRKYGVSGAQPVEAFTQTLDAAYNDWKNAQTQTLKTVSNGPSCDMEGNCD